MSQRDVAGNRLGSIGNYGAPISAKGAEDEKKSNKQLQRLWKLSVRAISRGRDSYAIREIMHHIIRVIDQHPEYVGYGRTARMRASGVRVAGASVCGKMRGDVVRVRRTIEHESVVYGETYHCGNVWLCPVCQSLIAARRGNEVQQMVDWAMAQGKQIVHLTYTASHTASLPLVKFGQALQAAYQAWRKSRPIARMADSVGMRMDGLGMPAIKVVEFTHSFEHGWHKHIHIVMVADCGVDVMAYQSMMKEQWVIACINHGLCAGDAGSRADLLAHGLHVEVAKDAQSAAKFGKYICKELCNQSVKVSRADDGIMHRTVYQLAAEMMIAEHDGDYAQAARIRDAIAEYALYTKGLHQMDWSNGLKSAVGIVDRADEELVEDEQDTAQTVCGLLRPAWQYVSHQAAHDEIKDIVHQGGGAKAIAHYFAIRGIGDSVVSADAADMIVAASEGAPDTYTDEQIDTAHRYLSVARAINETVSNDCYQAPPLIGHKPAIVLTAEEHESIRLSRKSLAERYLAQCRRELESGGLDREWLDAITAEFGADGIAI